MAGFKEMFSIPSRMLDSALVTAEDSFKSFTKVARSIPAKLRSLSAPRKNRNDGDGNLSNGAGVSSGSTISKKSFSPVNGDYISYKEAVEKKCEELKSNLDTSYKDTIHNLASHKYNLNLLEKPELAKYSKPNTDNPLQAAYTDLEKFLDSFERSLFFLKELNKFVKTEDDNRDKFIFYQKKLLNCREKCFKDLEKFSRTYKVNCSYLIKKLNSSEILDRVIIEKKVNSIQGKEGKQESSSIEQPPAVVSKKIFQISSLNNPNNGGNQDERIPSPRGSLSSSEPLSPTTTVFSRADTLRSLEPLSPTATVFSGTETNENVENRAAEQRQNGGTIDPSKSARISTSKEDPYSFYNGLLSNYFDKLEDLPSSLPAPPTHLLPPLPENVFQGKNANFTKGIGVEKGQNDSTRKESLKMDKPQSMISFSGEMTNQKYEQEAKNFLFLCGIDQLRLASDGRSVALAMKMLIVANGGQNNLDKGFPISSKKGSILEAGPESRPAIPPPLQIKNQRSFQGH